MQRAVHRMSVDAGGGLPRLRKPLLLLYGGKGALVLPEPSIRRVLAPKADARVLVYPDSGHAPFLEEAGRFGRDLAACVDTLSARCDAPRVAGRPRRYRGWMRMDAPAPAAQHCAMAGTGNDRETETWNAMTRRAAGAERCNRRPMHGAGASCAGLRPAQEQA